MNAYMDLTIAVGPSVIPWRPKMAATFVAGTDLPAAELGVLESLTGYGDTPLEAATNLLRLADGMLKKGEGNSSRP